MNLRRKKELASRALKVGKERISFVESRLDEVKEAITKQDIHDLKKDGAIEIKNISGRRKIKKKIIGPNLQLYNKELYLETIMWKK